MEELNLQVKTLHTYPLPQGRAIARTVLKWAWIVICILLFLCNVLVGGEGVFDGWLRVVLAPSIVVMFVLFKTRPARAWVDTPVRFRLFSDEFEYVYLEMPIFHANGSMSFVEKTYRMKYNALTEIVWAKRPNIDSVDFYAKMDVWSFRCNNGIKEDKPNFSKKDVNGVFRIYMSPEQAAEHMPVICEKLHWPMESINYIGNVEQANQEIK